MAQPHKKSHVDLTLIIRFLEQRQLSIHVASTGVRPRGLGPQRPAAKDLRPLRSSLWGATSSVPAVAGSVPLPLRLSPTPSFVVVDDFLRAVSVHVSVHARQLLPTHPHVSTINPFTTFPVINGRMEASLRRLHALGGKAHCKRLS